jgi:hypothetical protein
VLDHPRQLGAGLLEREVPVVAHQLILAGWAYGRRDRRSAAGVGLRFRQPASALAPAA